VALDALATDYGTAAGNALFYFDGVLNFLSLVQGLNPAVQRQLVSDYVVDCFFAAPLFMNRAGGGG
jgi:hypothetical protein